MKNDRITKQMKGTNEFDDLKTVFPFLNYTCIFPPFVSWVTSRTTDTQRELFFQKLETFVLGQTNWTEI